VKNTESIATEFTDMGINDDFVEQKAFGPEVHDQIRHDDTRFSITEIYFSQA
jgi:hypothetical protein